MTTHDEEAARGAASDPAIGGGAEAASDDHASFDRSVRFWLRAYPRRWRAVRADEMTAVLADLARPGATRLDVRTAFGLLCGGWATRWRGHPPLHTYVAYRWLSIPVPERYRAWVQDDVCGLAYPLRRWMNGLLGLAVVWIVSPWSGVALVALACMLELLLGPGRGREETLRRQLAPGPWDRGVPPVVSMLGPRSRPPARAALGLAASVGVTLAVTGLLSALSTRHAGGDAAIGIAVGLGVAGLAALGLRRLRSVPQPHRVLEVAPRRWAAATVIWSMAVVTLACVSATSGWADEYAAFAAPVGCALAPVLVLGWWRAFRQAPGDEPWAATDAWRAMTWRAPVVDEPQVYRRVPLTSAEPQAVSRSAAAGLSHPATAVPGSPVRSVDSRPTPIATPHQGAHPWDESSST